MTLLFLKKEKIFLRDAWWYTTPFASQLIRQKVGEVFFRCETSRLQSMPRSTNDVAKHAEDVAKHAEDGQGRCLNA